MSFDHDRDLPPQITYSGSPLLPDAPRERSAWRKFLDIATPWLKHKRDLAEDLLEAKVEQERALARKTNSEAMLNIVNAKKIAQETAEVAASLDVINATRTKPISRAEEMTAEELSKELADDLAELQAIIQELHYRHGTEIKLLSNKPVAEGER